MKAGIEVEILPVNERTLDEYRRIPSWFEVRAKLEVEILNDGLGGMIFKERPVQHPYKKDYGEAEEPKTWMRGFNTSNWVVLLVHHGAIPVGGLTMVWRTPEVRILNGRDDLACVWDIRVRPEYKQKGIGTELFQQAVAWSKKNGCRQLCVETQNVNMPACRFYLKQGCRLGAINRYAYLSNPALADEVQLIWFMDLQNQRR
jgi:GNAT superfamily N-acetyltransferase